MNTLLSSCRTFGIRVYPPSQFGISYRQAKKFSTAIVQCSDAIGKPSAKSSFQQFFRDHSKALDAAFHALVNATDALSLINNEKSIRKVGYNTADAPEVAGEQFAALIALLTQLSKRKNALSDEQEATIAQLRTLLDRQTTTMGHFESLPLEQGQPLSEKRIQAALLAGERKLSYIVDDARSWLKDFQYRNPEWFEVGKLIMTREHQHVGRKVPDSAGNKRLTLHTVDKIFAVVSRDENSFSAVEVWPQLKKDTMKDTDVVATAEEGGYSTKSRTFSPEQELVVRLPKDLQVLRTIMSEDPIIRFGQMHTFRYFVSVKYVGMVEPDSLPRFMQHWVYSLKKALKAAEFPDQVEYAPLRTDQFKQWEFKKGQSHMKLHHRSRGQESETSPVPQLTARKPQPVAVATADEQIVDATQNLVTASDIDESKHWEFKMGRSHMKLRHRPRRQESETSPVPQLTARKPQPVAVAAADEQIVDATPDLVTTSDIDEIRMSHPWGTNELIRGVVCDLLPIRKHISPIKKAA